MLLNTYFCFMLYGFSLRNDCKFLLIQINIRRSSCGDISCIINSNFRKPAEVDQFTSATSVQASKVSHFGVLMNNLNMLEKTFADSDVLRLENDILSQLDRLGALKLFHTCLSRTRSPPVNSLVTEYIEEHQMRNHVNDYMAKIVVRSGKKEKRKAKRVKALQKEKDDNLLPSPSKTKHVHHQDHNLSSPRKSTKYSGPSTKIIRNEAELTVGVKVCLHLLLFCVFHDYILDSYFYLYIPTVSCKFGKDQNIVGKRNRENS